VHEVLPELFSLNLVRGRGLLARAIMNTQKNRPQRSAVFAAMVGVVATKLPETAELVVKRVVAAFKQVYTHIHAHTYVHTQARTHEQTPS